MTKQRYQSGCVAGSKDRGDTSYSVNAFYVNLNNGNVNYNDRNNNGRVRACRRVSASEVQDAVPLQDLIRARREAKAGKVPSLNSLRFELDWIGRLLHLRARLLAGTWRPSAVTCFMASHPKAREIHAPDFEDRIVHHWLVPKLVARYEPIFIHDSYANRAGKGIHKAVERVRDYSREVQSGQGGGYYLQLDIWNFFISIPRDILWNLLKNRMEKWGMPEIDQRVVHALLRRHPLSYGVHYIDPPAQREAIPSHKRLENSPKGCGIPIGNLTSQFFSNVLLNELDQFVKHQLKAKRYARYVDDFVLVHESREQLQTWKGQIESFLAEKLRLRLKPEHKLEPLSAGCDFLGYVIYPSHIRVRRRVIAHARSRLSAWERLHVSHDALLGTPAELRQVASSIASYEGHFQHADAAGLSDDFMRRFPWIASARLHRRFDHRLEGQPITITTGVHMSGKSQKGTKRRQRQQRRDSKRFQG